MHLLANRIQSKLEESDYKGAVRISITVDSLAECNDDTLAINEKDPSPQYHVSIPDVPSEVFDSTMNISGDEVARAIKYFPRGSSGGSDGLRPQHQKDIDWAGVW